MQIDNGFQDIVQGYFASIYRLALATLGNPKIATRATEHTLVSALLDYHRHRSSDETKLRLFSLALRVIRREVRYSQSKPVARPSSEEWESRLWRFVDSMEGREHELCLLYYLLGFKVSEVAALLHVSQGAVRAQLEIFRGKFSQIISQSPSIDAREAVKPGAPGEPLQRERLKEVQQNFEARVAGSLQRRWPEVVPSAEELEQTISQVTLLAEQEGARRRRIAPYKWLALAGGFSILAVIFLVIGILAWLYISGQTAGGSQPTAWEVEPSSPLENAKSLTRRSDTETIRLRMSEGSLLWDTLWIDVQFIAYGPQSYIGLPRTYRAQAWISQPDQSLELFGLLAEPPSSLHMVEGGNSFTINPVLQTAQVDEWTGNPPKTNSSGKLLSNLALRNMVFPGAGDARYSQRASDIQIGGGIGASWSIIEGTLKPREYEQIAGRRALVIDVLNQVNQRIARLWLDVHTGLVLRLQKYAGVDFQILTFEAMVTEIAYNQPKPPDWLSEALQLKEPGDALEWTKVNLPKVTPIPTPTVATTLIARAPISPDPLPTGFDPSHSSLLFQFPLDEGIMSSITNTAEIPTGLIADGYLLEVIKFGLPWILRCDRSPDGQRIAFNTGTDGTAPADDSLRWFNLKEPQAIYQPLPGFHATDFAFSPDSRRMAVFGYGEEPWERGIYLLDIGNGEHHPLMSIAEVRSLVWSPDGEYLALIGSISDSDSPAVLVIHVATGQISYQAKAEYLEGVTYAIGPMADWGVEFPAEMGGMDECAVPP